MEKLDPTFTNIVIIGAVFIALVSFIGAVYLILHVLILWRKLTSPPAEAQPIARGELSTQTATIRTEMSGQVASLRSDVTSQLSTIKSDMNRVETETKSEMKRVESSLTDSHRQLYDYVHKSVHSIRDDLNGMALRAEAYKVEQMKEIRAMMDAAIKPIVDKLERVAIAVTKVETMLTDKHPKSHNDSDDVN